jgi:hypothetical protein
MTFTFAEDLTISRDFVRFHSGDTIEAEAFMSDALITSLVTSAGSKERAVIQAIQYKIARLSDPNFKADWLQVENDTAVKSLQALLSLKRTELGIPRFEATITHVYRADSAATEEPDYTNGRP